MSAAPALQVERWFNTAVPVTLERLRGRVVALCAFQMLCPGCVSHGLPQATRLADAFAPSQLAVIGLHTVFEHHAVMGGEALKVFIAEYGLRFPIAVDRHAGTGGIPLTMAAYGLRGTPSLVLLDRQGRVRLHRFGHVDDLLLGAAVGRLLGDSDDSEGTVSPARPAAAECSDEGCST